MLPPLIHQLGINVTAIRTMGPCAIQARHVVFGRACGATSMAAGHVDRDDFEAMVDYVSLSEYPLSGATAINRLLGAVEAHRGIS